MAGGVYGIIGRELASVDKERMANRIFSYPEDIRDALDRYWRIDLGLDREISNITVVGMGGSAIGGVFLQDYFFDTSSIPIIYLRDFSLPSYAGKNSLIVVVSYSGNTEETLRVFASSLASGSQIVVVTSDGLIGEIAQRRKIPVLWLPKGLQPRASFPYMSVALLRIVSSVLHHSSKLGDKILECANTLQQSREDIAREIVKSYLPGIERDAKFGKTPLIYSYRPYISPGYRLKTQLNENAKIHAFYGDFPEVNHNEIMGWKEDSSKRWFILFLRSIDEKDFIKHRIDFLKALWEDLGVRLYEIFAKSDSKLCRLYEFFFKVDMLSVVLALKLGQDPTPVYTISRLKEYLKERINLQDIVS